MKALLISEIFPPKVGGSGRWFWEIYSRMPLESCFIAAGSDPLDGYFDSTHHINCMRWPLSFSSCGITTRREISDYLTLLKLLRSFIKQERITAIHSGRCLPEGLLAWMAWKWYGIPYLCYVHGEELATYNSSRQYRFLSNLVYSGARRVIVNSSNTKNIILHSTKLSGRTVKLMHPGVDTYYFKPHPVCPEIQGRLGWNGRKVILTVGRLQKRKGHDHTIRALNTIKKCLPNILYAIAGDGEERAHLEKLTAQESLQNHVQFLGRISDDLLLSCYQQCDLFVLANREVEGDFEGFGMVLLEAQSCGKPIVAGKSGGTAETMIPLETGVLVDANYPEEIAQAIIGLISDDEKLQQMGIRAARWVRETFEWNALVVQAESIFREMDQVY